MGGGALCFVSQVNPHRKHSLQTCVVKRTAAPHYERRFIVKTPPPQKKLSDRRHFAGAASLVARVLLRFIFINIVF